MQFLSRSLDKRYTQINVATVNKELQNENELKSFFEQSNHMEFDLLYSYEKA